MTLQLAFALPLISWLFDLNQSTDIERQNCQLLHFALTSRSVERFSDDCEED